MGIAMFFFFWQEKFFKVLGLGKSDVRTGTLMTTCCVVNANILYTLIQLDNSKHRSRAISSPLSSWVVLFFSVALALS